MSSRELLEETIEAHRGRERWQAVRTIEFALSSGGLAFLRALARVQINE
jgi:hypothetical protein